MHTVGRSSRQRLGNGVCLSAQSLAKALAPTRAACRPEYDMIPDDGIQEKDNQFLIQAVFGNCRQGSAMVKGPGSRSTGYDERLGGLIAYGVFRSCGNRPIDELNRRARRCRRRIWQYRRLDCEKNHCLHES
jgi:hypothetical protein